MKTHTCPYRVVTARWTRLSEAEQDAVALRILGRSTAPSRITDPEDSHAVVTAALAGDQVAFAWLAADLRPALIVAGRRLIDDRVNWGGPALEALHRAMRDAEHVPAQWQRRRIHHHATTHLQRWVEGQHLRHRHDQLTEQTEPVDESVGLEDHLIRQELFAQIEHAFAEMPRAVADGFRARLDGVTIAAVADQHGMTAEALRQGMARRRPHLRAAVSDWMAP